MNVVIDGITVSPRMTSGELAHCMETVNMSWENMIGSIRAEGGKLSFTYAELFAEFPEDATEIMQRWTKIFEAKMAQYYAPKIEEATE